MFADLVSSPSSMEAGRIVDAFGMRHGYMIQQSDAAQAYLQAKIRGKPTWVVIPQDQWPEAWKGMKKPVCRLNVALYGHPDSGTDWEHHCKMSLAAVGSSGACVCGGEGEGGGVVIAGHRASITKSLSFCSVYMLMILSWLGQ